MPQDAVEIVRAAVSDVTWWIDRPYTYAVPPAFSGKLRPGMRVAVPFGGSRPREAVILSLGGDPVPRMKEIYSLLDDEPVLTDAQLHLAVWMHERFFCTVMEALHTMLPAGLLFHISPIYRFADGIDAEAAMAAASAAGEKRAAEAVALHGGRCELADLEGAFTTGNPAAAISALVKKGVLVPEAESVRRGSDKLVRRAELCISPGDALRRADELRRAPRQSAVLRLLAETGSASIADIRYFTGSSAEAVKALAEKGLVSLKNVRVSRRPDYAVGDALPPPVLNPAQQRAYNGMKQLLDSGRPEAALLYGVTGSGKTTVYIALIAHVLASGRTAIMMVPEIALTPQMLHTFSSHFGDSIAVLHSSLSMGERYDEWRRIREGEARVVIGTRSAVFAPVENPGIIIMDEEQEDTYKSESAPRYHARDVAKYLCARNNALLLMGSATPDVCSMYAARLGRYHLYTMPGRYNNMQLPQVRIADMRAELRAGNSGCISSLLRDEIQKNLDAGEQTILFLNRRGTNSSILCGDCGYLYKCVNCTANMTWHSDSRRLVCHYCGYSRPLDSRCPECGGRLKFVGAGTQRVVEELGELFPDMPVLRMDADSVAPAGSHRALLEKFRVRKIPVMVGTQMVAKGLNFENVTLVGIISADQMLYGSDYRAGERTFSLITQVIGRSGRFSRAGRAVIQTFTPDNEIIRQAAQQDYDSFYNTEIGLRQFTRTPPCTELFVLTVAGPDEETVLRCCTTIRTMLVQEASSMHGVGVLGPAPLTIARVNKIWRYKITVSAENGREVRPAIRRVLMTCNNNKDFRGVSVYADYNPLG